MFTAKTAREQNTDDDRGHLEQYEEQGQLRIVRDVSFCEEGNTDGKRRNADGPVVRGERRGIGPPESSQEP